jgi:hypothetical protein
MSGNVSLAELLLEDAYDVAVHEADGVDGNRKLLVRR